MRVWFMTNFGVLVGFRANFRVYVGRVGVGSSGSTLSPCKFLPSQR